MDLQERIDLMAELGNYIVADAPEWMEVKLNAALHNPWFTQTYIQKSCKAISEQFLEPEKLATWAQQYKVANKPTGIKIGLVMAGNIPLVGFHDFICCFISGHTSIIKLSSKDAVLFKGILSFLQQRQPGIEALMVFADTLKHCDAYIATGSNNSSRYFEYYFSKYPNIIRKNRTSVAVLKGNETAEQLEKLAGDIQFYFGLGCRNVTKIFVPTGYDFVPLIQATKAYSYYADHTKFKNNYDYHLSIALLNNQYYMSSDSILLLENEQIHSPIAVLHYSFYTPGDKPWENLPAEDIQCLLFADDFGSTQEPGLYDYADAVDTMQFLQGLVSIEK